MPAKLKLDHLVTTRPDLVSKETCLACLQDLHDELELVNRDGSKAAAKKRKETEGIAGRSRCADSDAGFQLII